MVVDLNYQNEKILFFVSNIFFMENFKNSIEILLLGDELWQIKFYLTKLFKNSLLSITHVTNNSQINIGQSLGFIKKVNESLKKSGFRKFIDRNQALKEKLSKNVKSEEIANYIELSYLSLLFHTKFSKIF